MLSTSLARKIVQRFATPEYKFLLFSFEEYSHRDAEFAEGFLTTPSRRPQRLRVRYPNSFSPKIMPVPTLSSRAPGRTRRYGRTWRRSSPSCAVRGRCSERPCPGTKARRGSNGRSMLQLPGPRDESPG